MDQLKQTGRYLIGQLRKAWLGQQPGGRQVSARTWFLHVLQVALFVPLLLVAYQVITQQTASPEPSVFASAPEQRILVVHNSMDSYGELTYANAIRALDYARLNHDDLDLAGEDAWPHLGGPNEFGT